MNEKRNLVVGHDRERRLKVAKIGAAGIRVCRRARWIELDPTNDACFKASNQIADVNVGREIQRHLRNKRVAAD